VSPRNARRPIPARADHVPRADHAPLPAAPATEPAPAATNDAEHSCVLVDASNVAHAGESTAARLANILLVRDKLIAEGLEPIIVADAALRHQIDDPEGYERLVESGTLRQAPAGTDADYFILSFARELEAAILSNDRFKDRIAHFAEVQDHIIRYMIVADEVVFERRARRRKGA
jgi:hypothetical protein